MKKNIRFDDTDIEKYKFHHHKSPILGNNIDINKLAVSNKVSFGKKDFKYFTGYKDLRIIRPLCIFPPKVSAYRRDFDGTKYMCFLMKSDKLLEKYQKRI